jgi:hypothetical protein
MSEARRAIGYSILFLQVEIIGSSKEVDGTESGEVNSEISFRSTSIFIQSHVNTLWLRPMLMRSITFS